MKILKYDPLFEYLKSRKVDKWRATFDEIEKVIGFALPRSAHVYPAWWANQNPPSSQSRAWSESGWQVCDLNLTGKRVVFQRVRSAISRQPRNLRKSQRENATRVIRTENQQSLETSFSWCVLGNIILDGRKFISFPSAPKEPGLYRFEFNREGALFVYIGETDNLQRRLQHYRTPGRTQQTNIRLNRELKSLLQNGNSVILSVIFGKENLIVNGAARPWDLRQKAHRRLVENAAIVLAEAEGATTLNL